MLQIREKIKEYFEKPYKAGMDKSFIKWFRQEDSIEEKNDALWEIWEDLDVVADETTEESFAKLQNRLFGQTTKTIGPIPIYRKLLRIASILIIPLLSFGGAYLYVKNSVSNIQYPELVECFVPNGEMRTILLSDSSTVQLNSGSILIYPKEFSDNTARYLYLNGEASFSVTRNENRPFIVKTSDMDVEVLGTVFNVSSYNTNDYVSTALESGKVNVHLKDEDETSFILEPNNQIVLDKITGKTEVKKVNIENVMAWKKGYIMVEGLSINDISKMLERKYDVEVHIHSDKYEEERITAKFMNNESLIECMSILEQLIPDMKFQINGNKVYIY